MIIAWLTDIHLEFPETEGLERFYRKLEKAAADTVFISGGIGQASTGSSPKRLRVEDSEGEGSFDFLRFS